jgi:hypothetical protein
MRALHTSLRFIPTWHETGLQRNPSTVSNYAKKELDQRGTGERGGKFTHVFLGVLKYEGVAAEDGSDEDLEFHVHEVLAHTRPMIRENGFVRFLREQLQSLKSFRLTSGHTETD